MNIINAIKENYKPLLPAQDYTSLRTYIDEEKIPFALIQWSKDGVRFNAKIYDKDSAKLALSHVAKFVDWNNFRVEGEIKFVYADYGGIKQDTPIEGIVYGELIAKELNELIGRGEFNFSEADKRINFKLQSRKSNVSECREFITDLNDTLIAMSIVYEIGMYLYDLHVLGPTDYLKFGKVEYNPNGKTDEVKKVLNLIKGNKHSELLLAKYYTLLQNTARPYIILGYSLLESIYYDSNTAENIIKFKGVDNSKKLKNQLKNELLSCIKKFCSNNYIPYNEAHEDKLIDAIDIVINFKDKTKNDIIKSNLHKSLGGDKEQIDNLIKTLFKIRSDLSHSIDIDKNINLYDYIKHIKRILDNGIDNSLTIA